MLIQTSCPSISKTAYPKDEVECVVILGSWAHDGWEVDIQHGEDLLMSEFENINPRWELIVSKASIFRKVTRYECCSEPYISIHISFPMKRRPVPEIEATRTPCILIMVLALSIFWLPPDSSLKFLLCGLLFFALNILLVYVAGSTKSPLLVGYAVSFIQSAMYIIVTTLFLQVFIITKLCNQSGPSRPPPSVMQFLTGPLGKYACLRSPMSEDQVSLDRVQLKEDSSANEP
ncbi:Neuronal acetylcholine receptor subunit alpha-10, partial [Stegodyphus mimosarum]